MYNLIFLRLTYNYSHMICHNIDTQPISIIDFIIVAHINKGQAVCFFEGRYLEAWKRKRCRAFCIFVSVRDALPVR